MSILCVNGNEFPPLGHRFAALPLGSLASFQVSRAQIARITANTCGNGLRFQLLCRKERRRPESRIKLRDHVRSLTGPQTGRRSSNPVLYIVRSEPLP